MDLCDTWPPLFRERLDGGPISHHPAQGLTVIPRADEQGIMSDNPAQPRVVLGLRELFKCIAGPLTIECRPALEIEDPRVAGRMCGQPFARLAIFPETRVDRRDQIATIKHRSRPEANSDHGPAELRPAAGGCTGEEADRQSID